MESVSDFFALRTCGFDYHSFSIDIIMRITTTTTIIIIIHLLRQAQLGSK